jgi:hypothetical protein
MPYCAHGSTFEILFQQAANQDLSNSRVGLRMKKEEIGGFQHAAVT